MPEGEWAYLDAKGPRTKVALRISSEANTAARLAATQLGVSKTAFLTQLVERWAAESLAAELAKTGGPT